MGATLKKAHTILNTDAATLSQWLENHTRQIYTRSLPTDQGRFTLQRARQRSPSPGRGVTELDGIYVNETGSEGTAIATLPVPAIKFTLLPLSNDRLEVRAECSQAIVYPVFDELLADIRARWPEAEPKPSKPKTRPPGRPRLEEDEWAREQYWAGKMQKADIRKEWDRMRKENNRHLETPQDSFNSMLKLPPQNK